jgi:hypothetical protein
MPSSLPGDPTRLLVAGDTHGNWLHWQRVLLPAARKHQVGGIVQLGDFRYWPMTGEGLDYLAWLSAELDEDDVRVIFLDGNHEDHKTLRQLPTRPGGIVDHGPYPLDSARPSVHLARRPLPCSWWGLLNRPAVPEAGLRALGVVQGRGYHP